MNEVEEDELRFWFNISAAAIVMLTLFVSVGVCYGVSRWFDSRGSDQNGTCICK